MVWSIWETAVIAFRQPGPKQPLRLSMPGGRGSQGPDSMTASITQASLQNAVQGVKLVT